MCADRDTAAEESYTAQDSHRADISSTACHHDQLLSTGKLLT